MKRFAISFLIIMIYFFVIPQNKNDLEIKIKGKKFFRASENIVLEAILKDEKDIKRAKFQWIILNKNNEQVGEILKTNKIEIRLDEGKYNVQLIANIGKKIGKDSQEIFVSSKDEVNVTFVINPPEGTKDSDTLFLAHEVPDHKEWVPYATQMKKNANGQWEATLKLKTGKNFKFQPTKGSWGSKARNKDNSDFSVTYLPYIDEIVVIEGFNWGTLVDNKKLLREPLLVPYGENFNSFKILWNNQYDVLYLLDKTGKETKIDIKKEEYGCEGVINNLKNGEEYSLKIGDSGETIKFKVPKLNDDINVVMISDSQNRPQIIEAGAKKIKELNPDLIISAGDNINDGLKAFSWDLTFFKPFVPFIKGIPFVTAMGNHEEVSPLIERYLGLDRYYNTYSNGLVRFLLIDSQTSFIEGSPQYNFIENVLKNRKEKYLIVVMHDSPYSYTPRHYSNLLARKVLAPLFEKYKVNIVFSGHNHVYERTKKINGVIYVTLPCFGSNKPNKPANLNETMNENSFKQVYEKDGFGILKITKNKIFVKIESVEGEEIDSFELE